MDSKITRLGESAYFECTSTHERAHPQWYKDGLGIIPDTSKKYIAASAGPKHSLTVNRVDDRDAGEYACVIKGHRSAARLYVEAKPEFSISDKYHEPLVLKAGNSVTVEVPFQASPQPRCNWKVRLAGKYSMKFLLIDLIC